MRRHPNPTLCPVRGIELYVSIAGELSVDLSAGYLFRLTLKVMFSTDHYRVPPQPHGLSYISGRPTLTQEKLFTALDLAALLRLFCGIAPCRCYVPCWLVLSGDCTLLLTARKYPQGGCTSGSPFAECVARQPSC